MRRRRKSIRQGFLFFLPSALRSGSLARNRSLPNGTSPPDDWTHYKYTDIQDGWIIRQGRLHYCHHQIKLLNIYQCKRMIVLSLLRHVQSRMCFFLILVATVTAVLAKIPTGDQRETMAIYLYRDRTQKPFLFLPLNEYQRYLSDTWTVCLLLLNHSMSNGER